MAKIDIDTLLFGSPEERAWDGFATVWTLIGHAAVFERAFRAATAAGPDHQARYVAVMLASIHVRCKNLEKRTSLFGGLL